MNLHFNLDTERTREAISVFASARLPELTKWRICKLLFLADKFHLVHHGRPITGDRYFALPQGPVPTGILNALNHDHQYATLADVLDEQLDIVTEGLNYPEYILRPEKEVHVDYLSPSDLEALHETVERYGHLTFGALSKAVHQDHAYVKAWARRIGERAEMPFEDFFEDSDADVLQQALENAAFDEALGSSSESLF